MKDSVKQRLVEFIRFKGISQGKFERACEMSNGYINNLKRSVGTEKLQNISKAFPELNIEWLLYGEGEMLKPQQPATVAQSNVYGNNNYARGNIIQAGAGAIPTLECGEIDRAPILPSTLSRAPNIDILEALEERVGTIELSPVRVNDVPITLWHRVRDTSLAPKYEIGDLLALWAYPQGEEDPIPGKLYGIDTWNNGLLIRKLVRTEEGYIARAVNGEEYPDYIIKHDNVVRVYKIMLMVRF